MVLPPIFRPTRIPPPNQSLNGRVTSFSTSWERCRQVELFQSCQLPLLWQTSRCHTATRIQIKAERHLRHGTGKTWFKLDFLLSCFLRKTPSELAHNGIRQVVCVDLSPSASPTSGNSREGSQHSQWLVHGERKLWKDRQARKHATFARCKLDVLSQRCIPFGRPKRLCQHGRSLKIWTPWR